MKLNEIEYKKLSEVKIDLLYEFYSIAFPAKNDVLFNNWKWLCRNSLNNQEPIVALYKNKIIAHAGLISTQLQFNNKISNAIWFVDFYILPNFRNIGIGSELTKKWMELENYHLTFCNKDSLRIFKKFDWVQNEKYYKSCKIINPLKWIPIINLLDDKILNRFNFLNIFNKSTLAQNVNILKLSQNINLLSELINSRNKVSEKKKEPEILKNNEWFEWRIKESPFIENYYLFFIENSFFIISITNKKNKKKLNIINSYYENDNYQLLLNQSIIRWAIENNIDIVWLNVNKIDSEKNHKKFFNMNFELTFACNSTNSLITKNILKDIGNLEGVDSDIEILNYDNHNFKK